jgi:hypothetical protein
VGLGASLDELGQEGQLNGGGGGANEEEEGGGRLHGYLREGLKTERGEKDK